MTPEELRARKEANKPKPQNVQFKPDGTLDDHPLYAVNFAELKGVAPDGSIINVFDPEQKTALLKMIKHGEFNQREAALLKYLLRTSGPDVVANLEDVGTIIGAVSPTSKGEPVSKQAAFGELKRIMQVIVKRLIAKGVKMKPGKTVDDVMKWLDTNKKLMKQYAAWKAKKEKEAKRAEKAAMNEFWKNFNELEKARRAAGLPYGGMAKLQQTVDNFPNPDGSRGLKSRGEKVRLPVQSTRYKGGDDAIDRLEGRHNND